MFLLIPLCLCLVALQIGQERRERYFPACVLKGLASLCFVVLGFLTSDGTELESLVVIGLILGCIADVLLSLRYVFEKQGQKIFLVGILVFLSGHIVYLAAILRLCRTPWLWIAAGAILTVFLMRWIFSKITATKVFKIFGIFYVGAIMIMNCVAVGSLVSSPSAFTAAFTAGAVLFLVSDIILILNTFGPENRFSRRVLNLVLYYAGQLLIASSLLFL